MKYKLFTGLFLVVSLLTAFSFNNVNSRCMSRCASYNTSRCCPRYYGPSYAWRSPFGYSSFGGPWWGYNPYYYGYGAGFGPGFGLYLNF